MKPTQDVWDFIWITIVIVGGFAVIILAIGFATWLTK